MDVKQGTLSKNGTERGNRERSGEVGKAKRGKGWKKIQKRGGGISCLLPERKSGRFPCATENWRKALWGGREGQPNGQKRSEKQKKAAGSLRKGREDSELPRPPFSAGKQLGGHSRKSSKSLKKEGSPGGPR